MVATAKQIDFAIGGRSAYTFLKKNMQKKVMQLAKMAANDTGNNWLQEYSYKMANMGDKNVYVIRLSENLRLIVEILDKEVKILDIINQGLHDVYFKNNKSTNE